MLRQSGFDETQFSEKSLEDMEFLRKMDESDFDESYKKGVNAVAHCLLRTS